MNQGQGGPPPGWPEPPPAAPAGSFGPGHTVPGDVDPAAGGFAPSGFGPGATDQAAPGELALGGGGTAPAGPDPLGMTDFVPSPGAGELPLEAAGSPMAPSPPATTLNDFAAVPEPALPVAPLAAAPGIPAAIPAAPPRAAPRRNNAAMAVGIGSIVVAMLGVIAFVLIRQDRKADEETEVATIALPPEPAPVASTPTAPPAAEEPGLAEPPPEPAATAPPPTTAPPKNTAPPKSTAPKPPPSSTAPPPGSTKPPSERPKIKIIPRPGNTRPGSTKPSSTRPSSGSGGGTTKRPKLIAKPK